MNEESRDLLITKELLVRDWFDGACCDDTGTVAAIYLEYFLLVVDRTTEIIKQMESSTEL